MEKSIKNKMNNLLFLCSGGGGSLRFIYKLWENKLFKEISNINVICDRECGASEWCKKNDINYKILDVKRNNQKDLLNESLSQNPKIIITNIFKILNTDYLENFKGRCINSHWSLLPSFSGLIGEQSIKAALEYKEKIIGSTVHYVSKEVDKGEPIAQVAFSVHENKELDFHREAMFRGCSIALFISLKKLLSEKSNYCNNGIIKIKNIDYMLNPYSEIPAILKNEDFWGEIKNWQ